jgi:murein DD-endopeptidase MepM/ murein hydrolase activator NlpD
MQFILKCYILAGVFINPALYSQIVDKGVNGAAGYAPPLNVPLYLAGNYGEIRNAHFHTGVDFKTEQVEGKLVLAADSGYVFRIAVQAGGYGHALYIRHPSGCVTVYGHLRQFTPEMDKWVKDQQYNKKSFEVDLYPPGRLFAFRRGEFIGYSGSTGYSGGPHLHFEIRDRSSSIPFNVLKYKFPLQDGTRPRITWLAVYPLDDTSRINGLGSKLLLPVNGSNGTPRLESQNITLSGNIGFGIETFDYLDNSANPCSPYAVSLYEDNKMHFRFVLDSIPFSLAGYINSHIDYEEKIRSGKSIQKLYVDPNNKLSIYKVAIDRGILRFSDTLVHSMAILVEDAYGNTSRLAFNIRSAAISAPTEYPDRDSDVVARFYYDSLNVFERDEVKVVVPRDALYTNIRFRYAKEKCDSINLSDVFVIHQGFTPLNKAYILSLKPRVFPAELRSKVFIAGVIENGTWSGYGGNYKNGFVTTQLKSFGRFYVAADTLEPVILPVDFNTAKKYSEGEVISFRITDLQSGIRKYNGYIDKSWALFEYDAKNDLLTYVLDGKKLETGKKHLLEIIVADNRDNVKHFKESFYF